MTYGSLRIAQVLIQYSKSTVARRMKVLFLTAGPKRNHITTIDADHNYKVADNLLYREFTAVHINKVWVSDIKYIKVVSYWMYLTTMIDLADRMVVGWSLSNHITTRDTVNHTIIKAVKNRKISKETNLMIHSDRRVQYASDEFRHLIIKHGGYQSMSRKGNCWHNAVLNHFFNLFNYRYLLASLQKGINTGIINRVNELLQSIETELEID
jgi:transposase InsO family protein